MKITIYLLSLYIFSASINYLCLKHNLKKLKEEGKLGAWQLKESFWQVVTPVMNTFNTIWFLFGGILFLWDKTVDGFYWVLDKIDDLNWKSFCEKFFKLEEKKK